MSFFRRLFASLVLCAFLSPGVADAKPKVLTLLDVAPSPPSLMVAKKLDVPLVIVLDPAKIQEPWVASKRYSVTDWATFVSRDVKKAMDTYFTSVVVLGPSDPRPDGPHLVADVKVDRVQFRPIVAGGLTYNVIEMQWGYAIRFADADEYLFSFAGIASSKETYASALVGVTQLIEDAITGLMAEWADKGVPGSIRAAIEAPAE
jgi:hypothetical protein